MLKVFPMRSRPPMQGLSISRLRPLVSHLLFVDDSILFSEASILFSQASIEDVMAINNVLQLYSSASGQCLNLWKQLFFAQILHHMLRVTFHHSWRLTLWTLMTVSLIDLWAFHTLSIIKETIEQKVVGWKEKLLSKGEKEVLIKAITSAIPVFEMSSFFLPISLCQKINIMVSNF